MSRCYCEVFSDLQPLDDDYPEYEGWCVLGAEYDLRRDADFKPYHPRLLDRAKDEGGNADFLFIFHPDDAQKLASDLYYMSMDREPISAERFIYMIADKGIIGNRIY